jgi:hypothetical protein
MPAESRQQQRLFGMVEAYKKKKFYTKNKALHAKIKDIARGISVTDAGHFAKTPHAGLPEKKAFIIGFIKRAHQYGVGKDDIETYIKLGGLHKEAILGELAGGLIRAGGMIGGSILGNMAGERAIGAAAAKRLPGFIQKSPVGKWLGGLAPKATQDISKGTALSDKNMKSTWQYQIPTMGGMTVGGMLGDPLVDPIASRFEGMDSQQPQQPEQDMNYLPPYDHSGYNGQTEQTAYGY